MTDGMAWLVGIDWASTAHQVSVLNASGEVVGGQTEIRSPSTPARRTPSCAPDPDAPTAWLRLARPALAAAQPRRDEETVASR